jgi:ankyrin repeat protein
MNEERLFYYYNQRRAVHRRKERMNRRIDRELIDAARENDQPEVSRLLSVGADVNATGHGDWTPLHWVSYEGYVQVVIELLEHGADTEIKKIGGWTPLHGACCIGHLAVVNELLSPNDSNGATTTILGKRKRQGANIDPKNDNGETPLHLAIEGDHLPIIKALLSGGADCRVANNDGDRPIDKAMRRGTNGEVAKYLLQQLYATICRLPLHELVEDLTWIGNPNSSDVPPLRLALDRDMLDTDGVVEILEYLVERNPELISSRDQDGALPLHLACRRRASFPIIQSLVNNYGASVKSVTRQGDLPLFLACEMPGTSLDTIFLLVKQNPMCDVVNDSA